MNSDIDKDYIIDLLHSKKAEIRNFGAAKLGLFGSFVRGNPTPESDVDLLVEFEKGKKNYDNFIKLAFYLEELLKRKVELVTEASLSRHIGPHIRKEVEYIPLDA